MLFPGSAPKMFKIALIAVASFTILVEATCPQTAIDAAPSKEDFTSSPESFKKTICKAFKRRSDVVDNVDECMEAFKTKSGLDSRYILASFVFKFLV